MNLRFEVFFGHHDVRPHPAHELLFSDERAVGLQQGQQEVEGAGAELDRNAVGEQPRRRLPGASRFRPAEVGFCVAKALDEYAVAWWLLAMRLGEAGVAEAVSGWLPATAQRRPVP